MRLVTIPEAMADLDLSRASLYRLLKNNNLTTYFRPGDRAAYVDLDVLRVIRQDFQPRKRGPAKADGNSG